MFERKFTFEGFDGKTYEDVWGFYLSKADLLQIQLGTFVGLDQLMKRLIETKNGKEIMAIVDEIIMKSVGHTSPDGRKFLRNDELRDEFRQTDAYSQLFSELVTDPEKVLDFIFGAVPKEIGDKMREERAKEQAKEQAAEETAAE